MTKNTRKLLALLLSLVMLFVCAVSVSAEEEANAIGGNTTSDITTKFYVQIYGAQMDASGAVSSRPSSNFTPLLYTDELTKGMRNTSYSLVYPEDDVTAEVVNMPTDEYILNYICTLYENSGDVILTAGGNVVDWDDLTTDDYYIRWYVLKYEKNDGWHIDGVIVEKETDEPIEIVDPDDYGKAFEYTSNFAYIYGYTDTTMGADGNLLRSEASAMIYRLVKQNGKLGGFSYDESDDPDFLDIDGEWFRSGIEYMNYKGAFADGDYVYPYIEITRGETFKLICLGLGFSTQTDLSYDIYAAILYKAGYIEGDQNGDLNIYDLVTRAEFCTIYNRIIGRDDAKLVTAEGTEITAATYGFTDLDEGKWYYETMLRATSAYDDNGYVDLDLRNQRNVLDDYA